MPKGIVDFHAELGELCVEPCIKIFSFFVEVGEDDCFTANFHYLLDDFVERSLVDGDDVGDAEVLERLLVIRALNYDEGAVLPYLFKESEEFISCCWQQWHS